MSQKSLEDRAIAAVTSYVPAATTLEPGPNSTPSNPKAALRRCRAAWQRAFDAYMEEKEGKDSIARMFAAKDAAEAYCNAMPMLAGYEGIRDFIACSAYGILIGAISREKSSQLLYAAQVALATLRHEPRPPKSLAA
jgi:hypothetical protein